MKKIVLFLMLTCAGTTLLHAQKNELSYSRQNNTFSLSLNNQDGNMSLTVKGDVRLTDDDKGVQQISPQGYIEYRNKNQLLNISADRNGTLIYAINGTKKTNPATEDQPLIEECVKIMIANGVDAGNRVKRIFAKSGSAGVLNETARFKSDYVKEIYLSYLLQNEKLSKDEMIALLNKTDQYLTSDYYKAELLDGVMTSFLNNEATANAYLKTVSNLKSDYYQYTTIKKLLNALQDEKQFDQVLAIVANMKSDYYQSEVLKTLLNAHTISDTKFSNVMKIATNMNSDYYKSEIISSLLTNKTISKDRYSQTIAAMQGMKSDYYQSVILTQLIDQNVKDESEWSKLIEYAGSINSESYQSEVLMKIARTMPKGESLKKELANAAKKIHSDYYYGKVKRMLDE